jgi:hypothetical protein
MWYSNMDKTYISRYQHWYTCPNALPVHRSSWLLSQPLPHLSFNLFAISETCAFLVYQTDATNTSHRKQETFICEYPLHWVLLFTKTHNGMLLFGNILLKHGRNFDYLIQPLNMRMRVCYLDCHEAGHFCYLVIRMENILRTLQLVYWLSLV